MSKYYATASACIRRFKARAMFLRAKSLRPLKVVRCFSSSRGMNSSNLAMHSSAKELETTSTPSKSRRTFSSPWTSGQSCPRTFSPSWRVPRCSPKSLNLNVIIFVYIFFCHHNSSKSDVSMKVSLNSDSASALFSRMLLGSISLSVCSSK